MDYILGTERCQSASVLCIYITIIGLISHELQAAGLFDGWSPSIFTSIVFSILSVAFRVMAIDRLLRLNRQDDYARNNPSSTN